jgi:TRAP transporter 4TM/12TM fusion protein
MPETINKAHPLDSTLRILGLSLCALIAAFTFYTILMGQFTAQVQRGIFLLGCGVAVFCLKPFNKDWAGSDNAGLRWAERLVNLALISLLSFAVIYLFVNYFEISEYREGMPNNWDLVCYAAGTLAVLDAVRRTDGWPLLSVVLLVLAYLFLGHYIPGFLGHHPIGYKEILEMSFGMNGVFGIALNVVVNVVYIFIIFGAILRVTGAGELFIDLAYMLTGRFAGGPAQSAVVASAFFGSINGSGPANVVSTGSFTIPLMKRTGFQPEYAGAVEATASCVGQIMPPIMGVGAFIMSEITGIGYGSIMLAALVPALLYSLSLMANVKMQAGLRGISRVPESDIPKFHKNLIPRILVLVIAIAAILWRILSGQTPATAGLSGAVVLLIASFFVTEMRPTPKKLIKMLVEGGKDGLSLTISCAGIGIIIGGISATGLGIKFSQSIIGLGEANLILALIMAAACCLMIGMGLPTAASYLMVVFIAAPAITKLGLPLLTAHLFIFYYAVMSAITPPVALCAYAGAGIAGSDPLKTGVMAVRLGAVGFLLPFLWIYNPELMLMGHEWLTSLWVVACCVLAVIALAGANTGFMRRHLLPRERLVVFALAAALALPYWWLRLAALALGGVFYFVFLNPGRSRAGSASAA